MGFATRIVLSLVNSELKSPLGAFTHSTKCSYRVMKKMKYNIFFSVFSGIAIKLEYSSLLNFSSFNPCPSLSSLATDEETGRHNDCVL